MGNWIRLRRALLTLAIFSLLIGISSAPSQIAAQEGLDELLTLNINAGFDGRFRLNQWMPVHVEINNQGDAITGRIVVRPETSGNALLNTFSAPVELPRNSSQTLFLYITARSSASELRVELLNETGAVITSQQARILSLLPRDTLYAVVTQATSGSVDLSSLNIGGYEAFQTNWTISDIPDRSAALDAINVMLINDIDTGDLTRDQHEALKSWVMGGGHLIVAGGANWQSTAAGLEDLLPLAPNGSQTVADLTQLLRFAGDYETEFSGEVIAATGTLRDSAEILATAEDDIPLAVRQSIGAGTVDYVAVDPSSQPLRGWDKLPDLWFSLLSSTDAQPSWTHGFSRWDDAISSVEIIPGVNLLPAVLGLFGFLAGYVFLIGPVNYLVLRRFNRLEYAWVTTPALIVVFSALAWSVGVDLRGTDATLSRVSVIQTWTDSDEARIDQLIGLLAPRRADYSLLMTDERLLRPVSDALLNVNPLGGRLQTNVDVQQTTRFAAVDFPVDASFIAAFNASGVTQKPDISGRMTLTSTGEFDTLQGSIRNDSDLTLTSPVVLARGIALYLENAIEPGDIVTVNSNDMTLTGESAPAPSSLEYAEGDPNPFATVSSFGFRRGTGSYESESIRSAVDILGVDNYKTFDFSVSFKDDDETQEIRRRQAFLDSFMVDQFSSTARGNHVYLAGWVDSVPTTEEVEGAGFKTVDTTLYIIELEVERQLIGEDTLISGDQFTWISRERTGVSDIGPINMNFPSNSTIILRFTPLPDARLSNVTGMTLVMEGIRNAIFDEFEEYIELWNWADQEWQRVGSIGEVDRVRVIRPQRYIGPQNSVEIRIIHGSLGGSLFIEKLAIEQSGEF